MGLNKARGNMYEFATHTFNTIKGKCYHDCKYCYVKKWGKLKDIRFDERELKTDLGEGNFIFVGSGNDMFAEKIPEEWIDKTLEYCRRFDNKYLFQSKNPGRMLGFLMKFPKNTVLGTTIETNRDYRISKAPLVLGRADAMYNLHLLGFETMITIEPILDFDLEDFLWLIRCANPKWVNIGSDSQKNGLPEPSADKIKKLIKYLNFTEVKIKKNLKIF